MKEELLLHWNSARRHEATGDVRAAKAEYEAMLAIEPMQVIPQLRLSRFAQMSDRYVASRTHALDASRIATTAHISRDAGFISLRLLAFAENAEVARLIGAMDDSDPEVLKQSAVFAQHLWLVGEYDRALEFLTRISARVRPSHLLSYTRANVLRSLGKLEEASEHYEYALRLSPYYADAHWSLAYHQPAATPGERIPRIRAAANQYPADSLEQVRLCFALFKELEGVGDTVAAWDALMQGAGIMRGRVAHDIAHEAKQLSQLKAFHADSIASSRAQVDGQPVPIFIVGLPRTGTTLLDRILGNHPRVVSLGERNDFDAAISQASDHFFPGSLAETRWDKLRALDPRKAGLLYMQRVSPFAQGNGFFIDKNPQNFFNIGHILKALPQARILCLRRDPMDACFSNLKELFEGGAYAYSYGLEELAAHHGIFEDLLAHWQQVAPASVHVVRYEDLVVNGDEPLRQALAFCGLEAAPGMLDITANQAPVSTASSSQIRQPIHAQGIGAWKRYSRQLEPLERLLGKAS
ncbi:MAG: sulfotransferase [Pseudoxanthomonas sp.]